MIREDFLIRMIKQVMMLLVASRRQRQEAQLADSLDTLDRGARGLLGLDTALMSRLPATTLRDLLCTDGELDPELDLGRAAAAAMLLQERAAVLDVQQLAGPAQAARLRSLMLWLEIMALAPTSETAGPTDPVVVDDALRDDLRVLATGQLDAVEDELFALLERRRRSSDLVGETRVSVLGQRILRSALELGLGDAKDLQVALSELAG